MPASPHPLSPEGRIASLDAMARAPVELLVIGGGITGAGIARDAALRGMRVALVEKMDFGSGTSSRSSKIVHGGVRYLEYLQFALVRESAVERRTLRRIAPHLVHPLPFLYPVFAGESLLKIRAGLKLFDAFAGSPAGERSRHLTPAATREWLPGLRDPLKGSVLYPEYITDDARLTLANIASAAESGALIANHAHVESLIVQGGRVIGAGVRAREGMGERAFEVRAEITVNAAGPWVPDLLRASGLEPMKPIIPSKGIHILLEWARLPIRAATFLRSRAGRRGLAIPRGRWVYVGTSDEPYRESLERPRAHPTEIAELVEMVADCFPEAEITSRDVHATWAGIRPLIQEPGKSTRDTSRHDEVWRTTPGLLTIAGGKLTTYRPMARRILSRVAEARGRALPGSETTHLVPLFGTPHEPLDRFRLRIDRALELAGVAPEARERIAFLYGVEADGLLALGREDPTWLLPLAPGVPALRGEVRLAADCEMVETLTDLMDRRLALLLFSPGGGGAGVEEAARILGERLGWSAPRRESEIAAYREGIREHGPTGSVRTGTD